MAGAITKHWGKVLRGLPGYDPISTAGDTTFHAELAERACSFFPDCLTHVKGAMAGEPLRLEWWQESLIANLFGWLRPDGTRRYREVFVFVPRKNGKTTLAAGIVLYMLFCDGEAGAEIYSAAADREQASLVYQQAAGMVLGNREMARLGRIFRGTKTITYERRNSSYKALSADADTKHGLNVHCAVIDELHAQPNRNLVDVLMTGTGSRRQPLIIHITTSDFERPDSICNEKWDYATKVRDGIIADPAFLPVVYEASRDDDWTRPETWAAANPNYAVSVDPEYLERECLRARESPAYENTFKRLHLNIRTEQDVRWLAMERWDACGGDEVEAEALAGKPCWAGLDLATTTDTASLVLLFPAGDWYEVLAFFWVPRDRARAKEKRNSDLYWGWCRDGWMEATDGEVTDYDVIRRAVNELGEKYDIRKIAIDRWNSTQLATQLDGDGFEVEGFGQGYASMSAPTKKLEELVLSRRIRHGGHPVLRWMASNVSVAQDAAGNLKPAKDKSTDKIDGIVALIMALGVAMVSPMTRSVYTDRGILVV